MMHPAQLPPVIQGNCLEKGYKFNQLSLYWAKKSDLGPLGVGGLKIKATPTLNEGCTNESGEPCYYDNYSIDSANVHPVNFPEDVGMYYTSDADPKTGESITYSIAGICGNELILYRSGQTTSYGLSSRKETFPAPTLPCKKAPPQPNPQPVPATPQPAMGFFESIVCFFKSLFGASC